jgi:hypothetical protein
MFFDKLYYLADEEEIILLENFKNKLSIIKRILSKIPLQVINPTINKFTLMQNNSETILLHWGAWKIDLLGCEYPIDKNHMNKLKENYNILSEARKDLKNIKVENIILVALLSTFEKNYIKENFNICFKLILEILVLLK